MSSLNDVYAQTWDLLVPHLASNPCLNQTETSPMPSPDEETTKSLSITKAVTLAKEMG